MIRCSKLLALLCLLLSFSGCGGSGDSPLEQAERALRTRVTASVQSGNHGQISVIITLTITNPGHNAFTLGSANAAIYDVEVDDPGGKRVWDYGLFNISQPTQVTVAPGAVQTVTIKWYPFDSQSINLMPGTYRVKAALLPQTINGVPISVPQNALPADTPVAISYSEPQPDRPRFQPGVVFFGINAEQDTAENRNLLLAAGRITQELPSLHSALMELKPGVSVEAGIAFLKSHPFIRFGETNDYVYLD